jgi:hypothetical protein
VSSNIGWNKIGGAIGKKIDKMLRANRKLGISILTEKQKRIVSKYIYDNPDWLNTTWADLVSGIVGDGINAANIYAFKQVGTSAAEGVKSAYEAYGESGTEGIFDLVNESYNEAYTATIKVLSDTSAGVTSALNEGIRKG